MVKSTTNTSLCLLLLLSLTASFAFVIPAESQGTVNDSSCVCPGLQDMIAQAEGSESCVYNDSLGIPTIGIGFNLQRSDAPSLISGLGLDYNSVLNGSTCLTQDQITSLFNNDIQWAEEGAANCVGSYNTQPQCIQNVLVDMTFNMGAGALCSWPTFVGQLANGDYNGAASNMQSTTWCSQVGNRCTRNVAIVQSC